jgi:hypothetical protein
MYSKHSDLSYKYASTSPTKSEMQIQITSDIF